MKSTHWLNTISTPETFPAGELKPFSLLSVKGFFGITGKVRLYTDNRIQESVETLLQQKEEETHRQIRIQYRQLLFNMIINTGLLVLSLVAGLLFSRRWALPFTGLLYVGLFVRLIVRTVLTFRKARNFYQNNRENIQLFVSHWKVEKKMEPAFKSTARIFYDRYYSENTGRLTRLAHRALTSLKMIKSRDEIFEHVYQEVLDLIKETVKSTLLRFLIAFCGYYLLFLALRFVLFASVYGLSPLAVFISPLVWGFRFVKSHIFI